MVPTQDGSEKQEVEGLLVVSPFFYGWVFAPAGEYNTASVGGNARAGFLANAFFLGG